MQFKPIVRTIATALTLSLACVLPTHAELQARDIGNTGAVNAFYDTTLNVTWLDAASGGQTWDSANAWAAALNVGGVTNWRLPTMFVANPSTHVANSSSTWGFDAPGTSEFSSLYYDTLGNTPYVNSYGVTLAPLTNNGGFQNLNAGYSYWIGNEYAPAITGAWNFSTSNGLHYAYHKSYSLQGLAVHSGDVGAVVANVPEPETYAMMLVGLGLIGGIARRRKQEATTG